VNITVFKNDQYYGPYSLELVREYHFNNQFASCDLVCWDQKNWRRLGEIENIYFESCSLPEELASKYKEYAICLRFYIDQFELKNFLEKFFVFFGKIKKKKSNSYLVIINYGKDKLRIKFEIIKVGADALLLVRLKPRFALLHHFYDLEIGGKYLAELQVYLSLNYAFGLKKDSLEDLDDLIVEQENARSKAMDIFLTLILVKIVFFIVWRTNLINIINEKFISQ